VKGEVLVASVVARKVMVGINCRRRAAVLKNMGSGESEGRTYPLQPVLCSEVKRKGGAALS
jgi:hypothetical protein